MADVTAETAQTLRGMATGQRPVLEGLEGMPLESLADSGLDPRAHALCRIAALVALGLRVER